MMLTVSQNRIRIGIVLQRTLLLLALLPLWVCQPAVSAQQTTAYLAGKLWSGTGPAISDAVLLVREGRIVAVGGREQVTIPNGATIVDLGNQTIIPGLVAVQTQLAGNDDEDRTLTPEIRALDGFDYFKDFDYLLQAGITSVQVSPGTERLMPGTGGVVRLAGDSISQRTLSERESLRVVLSRESRNPPTIYEPSVGPVSFDRPLDPTRPQIATLGSALSGLRHLFSMAEGVDASEAGVVREILEQKLPIRVTARTAAEIQGAVQLARDCQLSIILVDCEALETFRNSFQQWKPHVSGVILSGLIPGQISNPSAEQAEDAELPWDWARELVDAGIPVSIRSSRDQDLEQLRFVAGQFQAGGLTAEESLAAITSVPAALMGVSQEVGSLEVGKWADFAVLDGEPFALQSRIQQVFSGGELVEREVAMNVATVVQAGRVYLGDGNYLEQGEVLVHQGTIRGVGREVSAPQDAMIKSFGDQAVVVPGFIDMGTGLGMGGNLNGTVPLQTDLGAQLYADDPAVAFARKHGVTTALLSSSGGSVSPVVAFKLDNELRVVKNLVGIQFKLDGDVASAVSSNERLLAAGKAYVDSWAKYEKDKEEYEQKLKLQQEKEKAEKSEKTEAKADASEGEKKEAAKTDEKKPEEKTAEKKTPVETPAVKDPISGTWEGELDSERLPPQMKAISWKVTLKEGKVSGVVEMMRAESPIVEGVYDAATRKLTLSFERRGGSSTLEGTLQADGTFSGSIELGRMGKLAVTAKRTVVEKIDEPQPEPQPTPKPEGEKPAPEKSEATKDDGKKDETKGSDEGKTSEETKDAESEPKQEPLKEPTAPKVNEALEPYRRLFAGEICAMVESKNLNAIKATVELFAEKYGLKTCIIGADDLARQPNLLDGKNVSVIATVPFLRRQSDGRQVNLPQVMAMEGYRFGFQSGGTTGSGQLPSAVQYSVSQGLSRIDGMTALTKGPAEILGLENMGTIAAGRDADLVVLSGPPFEFSTRVLAVMIDGQWVYQEGQE